VNEGGVIMKVKALVEHFHTCGTQVGEVLEIELTEEGLNKLIERGWCEPVEEAPKKTPAKKAPAKTKAKPKE